MMEIEKGLNIILQFDREMKEIFGENRVRKSIMGHYGELLVANELIKHDFNVKFKGNLAGYDLLVNNKKIEIRTSQMKRERAFPERIKAWGWKLQTRDGKKMPIPIKYDFIILVKLNDTWEDYELFMLSKDEVEKIKDTYFSGYQTVARAFYLFKNPIEEAQRNDKHNMITKECINFNKNTSKFLINWDKLSL